MHGIEAHAELPGAQELPDTVEVEQPLHQLGVVRHGVDYLDLGGPQRRPPQTGQVDVGGLDVLPSGYHADNPTSGHILVEKLGFEPVGREMQYSAGQGRAVETILLRLTRARWQAARDPGTVRHRRERRPVRDADRVAGIHVVRLLH